MSDERLKYALQYRAAGIVVVKVIYQRKHPPKGCGWKKYKTEPPTEDKLREWFGAGTPYCDVAAITGATSGGLTVLDFDSADVYEQWKNAQPKLAAALPTSRSGRGHHVFFRSNLSADDTSSYDGIDIKANGLVVLPPSVHKTRSRYEWINPLPKHVSDLPFFTIQQLGLQNPKFNRHDKSTSLTQQTQPTEQTEQTHTMVGGCGGGTIRDMDDGCGRDGVGESSAGENSNSATNDDDGIAQIVLSTLPQRVGERNQKIFYLALGIKSMPGNWDKNPRDFLPSVQVWHQDALPNISTKDFFETWNDFLTAWDRIQYSNIDPAAIYELCKDDEPPPTLADDHPTWRDMHGLCVLCRELQRAHDVFGTDPFLSCRKIAEILKISHETANKYFNMLAGERYIRIIEKGHFKRRGEDEAAGWGTRFKYVGE